MRVLRLSWGVLIACVALPILASAQALPQGGVRLITLSSAGGALDTLARAIAAALPAQIGQQVFVENRTGAGGNLGAAEIARSTPDGSTIGMITIATHGINPSLYRKMPFDAENDFAPISLVAQFTTVLLVHPSIPARNLPEFVAYVKANPAKVSFGSPGPGTSVHMSGELLNMLAGIKMAHVPYRGGSRVLPDLIAGHIHAAFASSTESHQHVESGALRAIGVASKQRLGLFPDVPTIAEQGYPDFEVRTWFGIAAPKGTPPEIVNRYNTAVREILSRPAMVERFSKIGIEIEVSSPDEFRKFIRTEIARWRTVVKAVGVRVD